MRSGHPRQMAVLWMLLLMLLPTGWASIKPMQHGKRSALTLGKGLSIASDVAY